MIKKILKKLIPAFLLSWYHLLLVFLGAVANGFPGYDKKVKIIGITGTSGKSTTVSFISQILQEAGYKVASISSIRFKVGEKEWENKYKMTMPGRLVVQKFLNQARKEKCDFVVLEVTSEGISQHRHKFINFDTAVFTNLSPEHIESHGGFENYRNEKLKLFRATKNRHVINQGDMNAKHFWDIPAKEKIGFQQSDLPFKLFLEGSFNMANAAAAMAIAKAYGVDTDTCKKALEKVTKVPGRMEVVSEQPKVIVDYAHTPTQLEAVYQSFLPPTPSLGHSPTGEAALHPNLICVLGSCGGGRDVWKRPVLGEIAEKYCTRIFVTNEDPYDEDPKQIMSEILSGISNKEFRISNVEEILDRREAIHKAIKSATNNEVVIITGKGSEPWMCVANGKKIPWDDRQIVREALTSRTIDKY